MRSATNYHAWTHSWLTEYLPSGNLLDIGSGTANHLQGLADRNLVSLDVDAEAIAELSARYRDRANWQFLCADITQTQTVQQLGPDRFDAVMSSNVFEHIPDDAAAFRNCFELLKSGGRMVLVLPAHRALYGGMDRMAGHFRRYDKAQVRSLFRQAGFVEYRLRYVNALGAVGWFINNRLASHKDLSSPSINSQIAVFDRLIVPVLRRVEGQRGMPFGQSLIAVGIKP